MVSIFYHPSYYNRRIIFSVQEQPLSLCYCAHPLLSSEGLPSSITPFFPHNYFFFLIGTFSLAYKHALASPGLVKTLPHLYILFQLVLHFSACLNSRTFWKSCLYWLSPLPYLSLTPFWLPSRKPITPLKQLQSRSSVTSMLLNSIALSHLTQLLINSGHS